MSAFDQLETYAMATGVAHTVYMAASAGPEQLVQLSEQAMQLRNTLYADAVALATRGLISGDRIGQFKTNIGYKNLAFDLMALSGVLRQSWAKIAGQTGIQRPLPRWFVIRDAHVENGIALLRPHWPMSFLRGPMTRTELRRAREDHAKATGRRELPVWVEGAVQQRSVGA